MIRLYSQNKHSFQPLWILLVFALIVQSSEAQIKVRPKLYLGFGMGCVVKNRIPDVDQTTPAGYNFYTINLKDPKLIFPHGQLRLHLLQMGRVSLGYTFWAHHHQYPQDYAAYWADSVQVFPYGYNYNLHGLVLQYDIADQFFKVRALKPFFVLGGGFYYGAFKHFKSIFTPAADGYFVTVHPAPFQTETYRGHGFMIGLGITVLKYGYLYVGYMDLLDHRLPASRFIDGIIGFTI